MPLKPKLTARHTAEQLSEELRRTRDALYRDRVRFILFLVQGHSLAEAARLLDWDRRGAQRIRARYDEGGLEALAPRKFKRPKGSGRKALLDEVQLQELAQAVEGPAPDGGLWTGPKVARWIAEKTGREHVHHPRGWDYLRRLGFVLRRPRPKHTRADPAALAVFK